MKQLSAPKRMALGLLAAACIGVAMVGWHKTHPEEPQVQSPPQTISGLLDLAGVLDPKGPTAVLLERSPESGDTVAFVFAPDSPVGKHILATCVMEMPCTIEGVQAKPLATDKIAKLQGLSASPSAWMGIQSVGEARVVSGLDEPQMQVTTRFGEVQVNEQDLALLIRGESVLPDQPGEYRLVLHLELDEEDAVLVQSKGGSACPALFRLLMLSAQETRVSPQFGSCSDLAKATLEKDANGAYQPVITMLDFKGSMEPEADQLKASQTVLRYALQRGQILLNGKPLAASQ